MEKPKDTRCRRCGRALKDWVSKVRGYGRVCWRKRIVQLELFTEAEIQG